MTEHDQNRPDQRPARRRLVSYLGALVLCVGVAIGGYFAVNGFTSSPCMLGGEEPQDAPPSLVQAPAAYQHWPRPEVALVLTGQMHGYIDPCGCSDPQHGGLVRRYNFIHALKAKNWNVVGIDLGELPADKGIRTQNLLKYDLSVKALAAMNYRALGIGKHEILNGLGEGLAQIYDRQRPYPRPLALSLAQAAPGKDFHDHLNVRGYEIIGDASPKIGVISMMGPDFRDEFKQEKWRNNVTELPKALKAFADAGVEVGIILHHEYPNVDPGLIGFQRAGAIEKARRERALACAQMCAEERRANPKIPPIQLMMLLIEDSEPPAFLKPLAPNLPTQTLEIGHKGKFVGLVGVYREGGAVRLRHENVLMGEEWKPKKAEEARHPVIAMMEQYNHQLKALNMLAQSPRSPHFNQILGPKMQGLRAKYVGSERCADCHAHAYDVWTKSHHAKATVTLEKLQHPSGRQFDPECMRCHTTGFTHPGGYNDPIDLANWPPPANRKINLPVLAKHNAKLRGVSCESCHGPASEHVKDTLNKSLYPLINPYRPSAAERTLQAIPKRNLTEETAYQNLFRKRMLNMSTMCMSCHNEENDVKWGQPNEDTADKWKRLIHRTR